ncbi:uracil phosphoribosyltransferase [Patescibacteria group bacterium]
MKNVFELNHPFITDSLAHLRDKKTGIRKFRYHSDQICWFLFAEAIRGLGFKEVEIETPLKEMKVEKLADNVVVVPIFRAGLAMLFGAMKLLPKSKIGFVGLERDEKTALAREYYWKLPELNENSVVIITDPMLATGGSLRHVLKRVLEHKVKEVRIVSVVSAPEGIEKIHKDFPNVKIFTAGVDEGLNDKAFIVPGLGDYGDRYFGTE